MSILNNIRKHFTFTEDIDLSRRKVIKTAGALAALTVIGGITPSIFKQSEIERQIKSGIVENQTFFLSDPIIIDIPNVVIRNCNFTAVNYIPYMLEISPNAEYTVIRDCSFQSNGFSLIAIKVNPRKDCMVNTLQAAIDAAAETGSPVIIPAGKYNLGEKLS